MKILSPPRAQDDLGQAKPGALKALTTRAAAAVEPHS
jgi:hypothetical protein